MEKKLKRCPKCGKNSLVWVGKNKLQLAEKIENILKSHKSSYEKKVALFNWLKNLEVVDLLPSENQRINVLLRGRLYNELAKQDLREYKKLTADTYSKVIT
jgi:hypothetical protein